MSRKRSLFMAAALLLTGNTQAQDLKTPKLLFDGFGTLGVVHSSEGRADFTSGVFEPDGAGFTRAWSAEVDSRLGLQLTAEVSPELSGVVQLIAEQRYDETYEPEVEWANLSYEMTPALTVRVGRFVLPSFMASEYRKVGYAYPWVRPPQEVYRTIPITNLDGASLAYRKRVNDATNVFKAVYGRKDSRLQDGSEILARNSLVVSNSLEWGNSMLFASYGRADMTIESVLPLFDAFRQFGPEGRAIDDRFGADEKTYEVLTVGARHDPGDWFVQGELSWNDSDTFLLENSAWYVTGGFRIGSLTPYATLASVRANGRTSDPGLALAGLPPALSSQAAGLNAGLNDLLGDRVQQNRISVGARWDFMRQAALKVQLDYIDLGAGSPGVLINQQPDFRPGGSVTLASIVLDFVF